MRRPRRTAAAIAARNEIVEFIIYLRILQQSNILYFPRFGIFFLFEKENACKKSKLASLNQLIKYCDSAIGSLIKSSNCQAAF